MSQYAVAVSFPCQGESLVGVIIKPEQARKRGVLMVVAGGPQYRIGGHRQNTLWSRRLSAEGYPTMRFDNRGVGDSQGTYHGFNYLDEDIGAAVDRFFQEVPEMEEVALWGECNAASAILFYAYRDKRVTGAVLLNPWVRTEEGEARAILKHYYLMRLTQPDFWKKVLTLKFNPLASVSSALGLVRKASRAAPAKSQSAAGLDAPLSQNLPLPERMLAGVSRFRGAIMLVLSGRDLVAKEFEDMVKASPAWKQQLEARTLAWHDLPDGDHTFSSAAQRDQVADWGLAWLKSW
jgi:exosortase A-associated hydrolase 1